MSNNFKMVAKTMFGFEEILEKELLKLGAINIEKGVRNVSFEGDKENVKCQTHDVLSCWA